MNSLINWKIINYWRQKMSYGVSMSGIDFINVHYYNLFVSILCTYFPDENRCFRNKLWKDELNWHMAEFHVGIMSIFWSNFRFLKGSEFLEHLDLQPFEIRILCQKNCCLLQNGLSTVQKLRICNYIALTVSIPSAFCVLQNLILIFPLKPAVYWGTGK